MPPVGKAERVCFSGIAHSVHDLSHAAGKPGLASGSFMPGQFGWYLSVAVNQHLLQVVVNVLIVSCDQRDSHALLSGPSRSPDPVCVLLNGWGHVVVDHQSHIRHVYATPRNVGRHQDIKLLVPKAFQACLALVLRLPSVQNCGGVSFPFQHLGDHITGAFDVCKHNHLPTFGQFQRLEQKTWLVILLAHLDHLGDIVRHPARAADGYRDRMPQIRACNPLHRGWHGGTEHQRGAIRLVLLQGFVLVLWLEVRGGHCIQYGIDLRFEAHVNHAVCFIQDNKVALVEDGIATVQAIHHTSGRGDHDFATLA
eukprot:scaffold718_cov342-Pavlova_lutheri.AAC.15